MPTPFNHDTMSTALRTINRSVQDNRAAPFFEHLIRACRGWEDDRIAIAVYRDSPEDPTHLYRVGLKNGLLEFKGEDRRMADADWTVSEDYLRDIADNPEKYISHPEKLSLNWLVERVIAHTQ